MTIFILLCNYNDKFCLLSRRINLWGNYLSLRTYTAFSIVGLFCISFVTYNHNFTYAFVINHTFHE